MRIERYARQTPTCPEIAVRTGEQEILGDEGIERGDVGGELISLLLIVLPASAVLQFETSPEANIRTPEDALWWAVVTITTVGYGDKFPLSTEGRLIAALLMVAGVGMFGTFSGFVAAWFLAAPQSQSAELHAIAELREEVRTLAERLRKPGIEESP